MDMAKPRPPYVTFERKAREVRNADGTQANAVDEDIALVTPVGSKDRIERVVSEWFPALALQVQQGRFEQAWLDAYRATYEAWKRDEEPPLEGTNIKNWPVLTAAQVKNLRNLQILTVEDLACANEETMNRIGMGSRSLKTQAEAFLKAQHSTGPLVQRLAALENNLASLLARNELLEAENKKLQAAAKEPA